MAYRCNPCRHTSAPFPIARSEWDMKQNARFCPDCQCDYILSTNKYPNPPSPKGNCNCGCKPCCCKPICNLKPHIKPPMKVGPCFPPHPGVSSDPSCFQPHHCNSKHHPVIPHPVKPPPPAHQPAHHYPVVPYHPPPPAHQPQPSNHPPNVIHVPKINPKALSSFFFFE